MKLEYILIHEAIHDKTKTHVGIHGVALPIQKTASGLRFVDYHDNDYGGVIRFMEQNKAKNSQFAARARNGEKITWGIKSGEWILLDAQSTHMTPMQNLTKELVANIRDSQIVE